MEIKTLEIAGFGSALSALRLPFGKECRSLVDYEGVIHDINDADRDYWGDKIDGVSHSFTGHSYVYINDKDLTLLQTLIKRGDEHAKVLRGIIVYAEITAPLYWWNEAETYIAGHQRLCSESTMHIDCRGLRGEELQKAKAEISCGKELTKIDFFSYQCLRNMYIQRRRHRLPEWGEFCSWMESLPFFNHLIYPEYEEIN